MNPWEVIVLGLVQGATEFLPVSSSGHLVIGQTLLGLSVPGVTFEIAVHLATLASVLIVYRDRVGGLTRGAFQGDRSAWRYLGLLVLATVPAAALGVGLGEAIEALFERPAVVGVALLVTGAVLWTSKAAIRREPAGSPGPREAVLIGLAQAFALVPGISRSGATVVVGLWLGLSAREAAAFSFLMSIPAILGAAVLKAPEMMAQGSGVPPGALWSAALVAGLTGIFAIRSFVALLGRQTFHRFGLYCWIVGGAFLTYLAVR